MAVLLLGILMLAYGTAWLYTGLMVKRGLEGWVAQQRAQGLDVTYETARVGGFPLAVSATLSDVSAQASPDRGGWSWRTPTLRVDVAPWAPADVRFVLHLAPHEVVVPRPGGPLRLSARADEAEATVTLDRSGPPDALHVMIRDAVIDSPAWPNDPATLDALNLDYDHVGVFDLAPADASDTVTASLSGLHLPAALHGPFSSDLADAAVDATVMGPLPRDRSLDEALRAWTDADGALRLNRLAVTWDPLSLESSGTLKLDTALQPEGAMNARISGFMPAIDALQRQGLVRGRDATMAKVLLGTMARRGPDGTPRLDVPVVVRNGALWAGPVKMMPLPRMPWGPPEGSLGAVGVRPGFNVDREGSVVPRE
ncbi:DUF2125 domain-containing protein [Roseospira marina]|uniref:DUF2125 domain-containing protein n=1 Tax=Roseospira marina TaxID=140057 RepID=UPI001478D3E2|nr:DUF2125 domain-containing protein [Roseospira marina]MBB4312791.1 hypothetical protein [Roseospira marina]MBB5086436.1 hypothetical protein [Roseospira marina]